MDFELDDMMDDDLLNGDSEKIADLDEDCDFDEYIGNESDYKFIISVNDYE